MPVSLFFVLHLYLLLKHNELKQLIFRGERGSINRLYNNHRHKKALYHNLLITVRIYLTLDITSGNQLRTTDWHNNVL